MKMIDGYRVYYDKNPAENSVLEVKPYRMTKRGKLTTL